MAESKDPAVDLVKLIAKALVDEPDSVSVDKASEQSNLLKLTVAPGDLGKVIGKKGRTAKSIRTVLSAAGAKRHRRYALDIVEP